MTQKAVDNHDYEIVDIVPNEKITFLDKFLMHNCPTHEMEDGWKGFYFEGHCVSYSLEAKIKENFKDDANNYLGSTYLVRNLVVKNL